MTLKQAERLNLKSPVFHKQSGERVLITSIARDDTERVVWIHGQLPGWKGGTWHHFDLTLVKP